MRRLIFVALVCVAACGPKFAPPYNPIGSPPRTAPAPPGMRTLTQTVLPNVSFTVSADQPDLTNVDAWRLYIDEKLVSEVPLSARNGNMISFPMATGLPIGKYAVVVSAVNKDAEGESERRSDPLDLVVEVPIPPKFTVGQRIKVVTEAAVWTDPVLSFPVPALQLVDAIGQVVDGPRTDAGSGLVLWKIDYVTGTDGWSTELYLAACDASCDPPPPPPICVYGDWANVGEPFDCKPVSTTEESCFQNQSRPVTSGENCTETTQIINVTREVTPPPPPPTKGSLTVTAPTSACNIRAVSVSPFTNGGGTVRFYANGGRFGNNAYAATGVQPVVVVASRSAGTYKMEARWTKSGQPTVTLESTVVCGGQ